MGVHIVQGEWEVLGFLFPDLYYSISYCAAASLLFGQYLELRCAWASASRAVLAVWLAGGAA